MDRGDNMDSKVSKQKLKLAILTFKTPN